mmetsp:Transcript_39105/g.63957  ORF Transcript_39105/g.63957 Transcript_39105/m.63957 type:complete len:88 (+) Transcript_39105:142-405(+)|eukprot:CAMPEP_0202706460 /NCGR_PEP_ID=MMETSP1385-20130828/18884_1 /ASSEMBLY_ACC=CAM_ASM_000861 /TAXON_ID=933848 /ORGANISM="Elphidium margaritaceum" /LENGTH=87 /DNA_ID=CAMNT_0049364935 /DNA_START=148 /DNA_END=411 /DNA_ORIENTATION=+
MNFSASALLLVTFVAMSFAQFADVYTNRDPNDHGRNLIGVVIGFGCGLVVVFLGLCCWGMNEGWGVCKKGKRDQHYSPPPETGKSDE